MIDKRYLVTARWTAVLQMPVGYISAKRLIHGRLYAPEYLEVSIEGLREQVTKMLSICYLQGVNYF